MIDLVTVEEGHTLAAYGGYPELATTVHELEDSATQVVRRLNGRTVWMVNSTAHGGGVAEMMPVIVSLLRQLGVRTEWAVIRPHDGRYFPLTKRLHNLLHGAGGPNLGPEDRALRIRKPALGRRVPLVGRTRGPARHQRPSTSGDGRDHQEGARREGHLALPHRSKRGDARHA